MHYGAFFKKKSLGILKRVSETRDATAWTNSMACSFPSYFYLRDIKSQWRPGIAITNTQFIADDSWDIWSFTAWEAITAQTSNVLHWRSKVDTLKFPSNLQEVVTRKPHHRKSMFISNFLLCYGVDTPSAGLAVHFSFTLYIRVFICK